MYSKKNGYYKFYNKDKLKCRIRIVKCSKDTVLKKGSIIITYRNYNDTESNVIIKNNFSSDTQVIHYILSNLENNNMMFDISVNY